jgi:hypothetical protein
MTTTKETAIVAKTSSLPISAAQVAAPPQKKLTDGFGAEIAGLIHLSGTIELTAKQEKTLFGPVKEEDIEIRPDGLIYLPWMEYVTRLKEAFGLRWTLLPEGLPKTGSGGNSIMWGFWLVIDGKPYGFAIGEQAYYPENKTMSWSDACEGAKSNALMRLCKGIGISLELWRPSFIKKWKVKYAKQTVVKNRHGEPETIWVKNEPEKSPEEKQKEKATMPKEGEIEEAEVVKKKAEEKPKAGPKSEPTELDKLKAEVFQLLETLVKNYNHEPGELIEKIKGRVKSAQVGGRSVERIPEDLNEKEAKIIRNALIKTVDGEEAARKEEEEKEGVL